MLLVTFHGGSGGITNVYAYDTSTGELKSQTALQKAPPSDAELRGMIYANSLLYVVDGGKSGSNILCYSPPTSGDGFTYIGEFIGPSLSKTKDKFENSIGHPYDLVFDGTLNCYISNQDTNVVAQAQLGTNYETASLKAGCQSSYLNGSSICPKTGCVFLDGTFVASQVGALPDVDTAATDVPALYGGLFVTLSNEVDSGTETDNPTAHHSNSKEKVQNSVRDVAIWGAVLLVCDEPANCIRMYSIPTGNYLGACNVPASPTHLAIFSHGLYVSAGNQLYWGALGSPFTPSSLSLQSVLTAPIAMDSYDVGGVTFDPSSNTIYVAYQQGKGTTGSGAIYSYIVTPGASPTAPPTFGQATIFANICADTPEFLLFLPS